MILRNVEKQIVDVINNSGMPIDAIYYLLKSIMADVTIQYEKQIEMEENQAAAAQKDDSDKVD